MATTPSQVVKKICPVCDNQFEPTDYLFHVYEEMIKQLMMMNDKLSDISDAVLMTYTYMKDEEDREGGEEIDAPVVFGTNKYSDPAENGIDDLIIDDSKVEGTVSPIPEPSGSSISETKPKPEKEKKPVLTDQEISDLMNRIIKEEPGKRE